MDLGTNIIETDLQRSITEAAKLGNAAKLKSLLQEGQYSDTKDERGWTALHYAAAGGHKTCVELLLAQGNHYFLPCCYYCY